MANNNEQQKQGQVQVNMTPEVEKGVYSNLAIMGFTPTEFIMDFVFHHPGMPRANVQSRVVMSPVQAKRLMRLLEQNMANYEKSFGAIKLPEDSSPTQNGPISPFKIN
ncbi:MAG: DUF3467 domain-containing protein [Bacteroidaceae bacterium]|jgi:hypothetical protein|nr:DUF3467 domain-containing protein [Bacteroidaceae bacterium]MBQ9190097.1 DUF3467 domain-containing protein [Bacteroidaceae bacterium]MBR1791559.1 DUF3467 domain-containing protein [Bacteroidaceae bacterium]